MVADRGSFLHIGETVFLVSLTQIMPHDRDYDTLFMLVPLAAAKSYSPLCTTVPTALIHNRGRDTLDKSIRARLS